MHIVNLYPNIQHNEDLTSLRTFLELRDNRQILSDTLKKLAEVKQKNSIVEFDEKNFIAIGTKFAPPYAVSFMADLGEKILSTFEEKPMIWRYIDGFFLFGNMEKNVWKVSSKS